MTTKHRAVLANTNGEDCEADLVGRVYCACDECEAWRRKRGNGRKPSRRRRDVPRGGFDGGYGAKLKEDDLARLHDS